MASLASIRAQVEERLSGRVTAPFTARQPVEQPVLVTGIPAIDSSLGGIPCGEITEIVGARWSSTGRKSLQSQLLSRATKNQFCALIDATDPKSGRAAGVDLRRLLWIRCRGQGMKAMEQAFKSADLLLQESGGIGLLVLDLAGVSERFVRKVPLSTWFRFRAVVEKLSAPLVVLTSYAVEVFDCRKLSCRGQEYVSYQMLRNVLAAYALNLSFCVLLDARRPDLREQWYTVMSCVRSLDLRTKCKILTWQELSAALPLRLQQFLELKYGIVS